MSNARTLVTRAWQSTLPRWSGYTLGECLYFVFASALVLAVISGTQPFWSTLRDGVFATTVAIVVFAVAVFLDELRSTPARMRRTAVSGDMDTEFQLHIRVTDCLQRAAVVLKGSLDGYVATQASNRLADETALVRLREDFASFGSVATHGNILDGSWRRRRRAKRIFRNFMVTHGTAPDVLLATINTFLAEY